jgi:hypothetical protein
MEEEGVKIIVVTFVVAIGIIIVLLKVISHFTGGRSSMVMPLLFLALVGIVGYMYMRHTLGAIHTSGSMEDSRRTINSLFRTARAVAEKHYRSTGVRFQQIENDEQYAILIIQEPNLPRVVDADDPNRIFFPFVAMTNRKPVNLTSKIAIASQDTDNRVSIIFSSAGTLSKRWVMMKANPKLANDRLYGPLGVFDEETVDHLSDTSFYIYERKKLEAADNKQEYFRTLKSVYIKPDGVAIFQ